MTQNQLDIPQISFERYIDLLKRRKWHVLPVSVLGLLVGAIVASMVPQFYVAVSVIHYEGEATGELAKMSNKDPMMRLVRRAEYSIPNVVAETLHELGWPEAHGDGGPAFREQVESRVSVHDEKGEAGRDHADLRVTYKDTDIDRAVTFTNTLVKIWMEKELAALETKVADEIEAARTSLAAAGRTVAHARKELQIHEQTHGLDPANFNGGQDPAMSALSKESSATESEVRKLQAELGKKQRQYKYLEGPLSDGTIPQTIQGRDDSDVRKQLQSLLGPVQKKATELAARLKAIKPLHPEYESTKLAAESAGKELKALLAKMAEIATQDRPSQEYLKLKAELVGMEGEIAADKEFLKSREAEALRLELKRKARPAIVVQCRAMLDKLRVASQSEDRYRQKWNERTEVGNLVRSGNTIKVTRKAKIPRTPTETSGTLIALAGSLIGLGIAIALVLLLDTLRSTFKTLDDVERGLAVPVLGAMAHLQTADDRIVISKTRRRVSVACGAFVFLSVSLVTVYYVAPWRLPDIVHQALHLLLGAPR